MAEYCYHSGLNKDCLPCWQRHAEHLEKRLDKAAGVIRFYADPETYFAIGFFPDPPCGEFVHDFDDQGPQLGNKPGKRARDWEEFK